jgi:hypothetical protein
MERKRNTRTVKNLYTVNQKGDDNLQIQTQTDRQVGMKHDYKVYKDKHPDIPKDVMSVFDLGFFGVEKDHRIDQKSSLPFKRKRTAKLLYIKKSTTEIIPREE